MTSDVKSPTPQRQTPPPPPPRDQIAALRDERLRTEKTAWALKGEVEALSTRRDDAARRDRQREREEVALSARREAIAAAEAREKERLSLATAAKERLEAEVRKMGGGGGVIEIGGGAHGMHRSVRGG